MTATSSHPAMAGDAETCTSSATTAYAVFGGTLRSELPFPELEPCDASDAALPEWSLRIGDEPPPRPEAVPCGERQIGPERYRLLRVERGFRLEYSHAGTFDVDPSAGALTWYPGGETATRGELARSIVLGPALALMLEAQGHLCLHGGAVGVPDGAVAFVAPKHHGKSTLVMAMVRGGAEFLSDDTIAVAPGRPCMLKPGVRSARLWADSAETLRVEELCERVVTGIKTNASGFHGTTSARESIPLRAIYLLHPEPPSSASPPCWRVPLPPGAAVATLGQQAKLPDTLVGFAAAGRRLSVAARVASEVPVFELHLVRDFAALPDVVSRIVGWHADGSTT